MTRFLSIRQAITAWKARRLTRHVQRRIDAATAYQAALDRKDARAQHDRWPALRDSTSATLAAEIGRKWA